MVDIFIYVFLSLSLSLDEYGRIWQIQESSHYSGLDISIYVFIRETQSAELIFLLTDSFFIPIALLSYWDINIESFLIAKSFG